MTCKVKKKSAVPIGAKHPLRMQEKDFRGSRFKYNSLFHKNQQEN